MADNEKLKEFVKDLNAVGNIRNLEKTMNEIRSLNIPESPDEALQRDIRQQQYDTAVLRYKILQEDYEKSKQPQKEKVLTEDDAEYWKRLYELENWRTKYLELTEPKEETINYGGFTFGYNRDNGEYYIKDEDEYNKAIDIIYNQKKLGDKTIIDKQTGEEEVQDIMQYAYPETERIKQKQYLMDRQITVAELDLVESGFPPEQAQAYVGKGLEYAAILVDNGFDDIGADYEEYVSMFDTRKGRREARRAGIEAGRNIEDYEADKLAELAASNFSNAQEIDQFIEFYYNGFGGGAFTKDDAAAIVRWDKNIVIKDRPVFQSTGE